MELEEMKRQWNQISNELAEQKFVNKQLIMEMTKQRFNNKIGTIGKIEGFGSIICFLMALFLLFNIYKMDSPILFLCAILSISILIIIPLISFRLIGRMKHSTIATNNYSQSILAFAQTRKRFLLLQKSAGILAILLMLAITPVVNKISGDEPFEYSPYFWIGTIVFVLFFARWGYKRYDAMTGSAEELLRELAEE